VTSQLFCFVSDISNSCLLSFLVNQVRSFLILLRFSKNQLLQLGVSLPSHGRIASDGVGHIPCARLARMFGDTSESLVRWFLLRTGLARKSRWSGGLHNGCLSLPLRITGGSSPIFMRPS
jgi:hypothetical protein